MNGICNKHCSLAGNCEQCGNKSEIAELRSKLDELQNQIDKTKAKPLAAADLFSEWRRPGGLLDGPFA